MMPRIQLLSAFCLVAGALLVQAAAHAAESLTLIAPDGKEVLVFRDSYGVPHIKAENEAGMFFGQGFAVAQDRPIQLELNRRTAEGRMAMFNEILGSNFVQADRRTRQLFYTPAERSEIFNGLSSELQNMIVSYGAGINRYLDSMRSNPGRFGHETVVQLEQLGLTIEEWTPENTLAVIQFLLRRFGAYGGNELLRLSELQQNGQAWFDENRPLNDSSVYTTIPPGESDGTRHAGDDYAGMQINPDTVRAIRQRVEHVEELWRSIGIPNKFGSFAALVAPGKSANASTLMLGAPQMGTPELGETNIVHEVELKCPGLHVAGVSVAGVPLVIIGRTAEFAWTFTSGLSDNRDVYIDSTESNTFGRYFHKGEWFEFDVFNDTIMTTESFQPVAIPYTHYRTVNGPVFGDDLDRRQVYSLKMSFWKREHQMAQAMYNFVKATGADEFEAALEQIPLSFNVFYAGKDQEIRFWHVGWFQDRTDGVDPRLPHKGDGSQEWGGFIPFADLPQSANPEQHYFVNWNNKPARWWNHGDAIEWTSTSGAGTWVLAIDNYVGPRQDFSFEQLKRIPREIGDVGTYQQALEFFSDTVIAQNIVAPGQSEFVDINGVPDPHTADQWPLFQNGEYKDWRFNFFRSITSVHAEESGGTVLGDNYPEPFSSDTHIDIELRAMQHVRALVYNNQGQPVRMIQNAWLTAGRHRLQWDGRDARGRSLPSGSYYCRVFSGGKSHTEELLLLR